MHVLFGFHSAASRCAVCEAHRYPMSSIQYYSAAQQELSSGILEVSTVRWIAVTFTVDVLSRSGLLLREFGSEIIQKISPVNNAL